jgi:hypothetical protein
MKSYWATGIAVFAFVAGSAPAQTPPSDQTQPATPAPFAASVPPPRQDGGGSAFERGQAYTRDANKAEAAKNLTSTRSTETRTETTVQRSVPTTTYSRRERIVTPDGESVTGSQATRPDR